MTLTEYRADIIAKCFELAYEQGYDLEKLAEHLLLSEAGQAILSGEDFMSYTAGIYMLQHLVVDGNIPKSDNADFNDYMAWYAGHIYKHWYDKDTHTPEQIYKYASMKIISGAFGRLHTHGFEYCIDWLGHAGEREEAEENRELCDK